MLTRQAEADSKGHPPRDLRALPGRQRDHLHRQPQAGAPQVAHQAGLEQQQGVRAAALRVRQPDQTGHLDRLLQQVAVCAGERLWRYDFATISYQTLLNHSC